MRPRRGWAWAAALAVTATSCYLGGPRALAYAAAKKAGEMGYDTKIRTAGMEGWKIVLEGVTAKREGQSLEAETVEVEVDRTMHVKGVTASRAKVVLTGGQDAAEGGGRKAVRMTLRDSTVLWTRGGTRVEAKVRTARRDEAGGKSMSGDLVAETASWKISIGGASIAEEAGVLKVDAATIEATGRKAVGTEPDGEAGGRTAWLERVEVRARTARIKSGEREVRAQGVTAEADRRDGRSATVRADKVEVEGLGEADGVKATLRTKDGTTEVEASARSLETRSQRLSSSEFVAQDVAVRGMISKSGEWTKVEGAEVRLGGAAVTVSGTLGPGGVQVSAEMREVECQDLLESIPKALLPRLIPGTEMGGSVAWRANVSVDLPGRKKPTVSIWMKNRCTVRKVPGEVRVERIRRPFRREVYGADGERKEVESGPGTEGWTPFSAISPFLPAAIQTTEDPAFLAHRGFLIAAFENSLIQNISEGKFARGGSTITMQLAKNLWLAREKTLSRKMQEAVLTMLLEKEMSKQEIMEQYMNCVEFGPNVYGVRAAAMHYFSKKPATLSLSQSLFLASILPSPRGAHFGAGGKLSSGRMGFIHRMMKNMLERNRITGHQYEIGMQEIPVLGEASSSPDDDDIVSEESGIEPGEWR